MKQWSIPLPGERLAVLVAPQLTSKDIEFILRYFDLMGDALIVDPPKRNYDRFFAELAMEAGK